jgi:hypothetical protein
VLFRILDLGQAGQLIMDPTDPDHLKNHDPDYRALRTVRRVLPALPCGSSQLLVKQTPHYLQGMPHNILTIFAQSFIS